MSEATAASSRDRSRHADDVPVLISGAGPVGLTLSLLLSRQGIRNRVVEKRSHVSTLPRARGITVRSVEILSQVGLLDELDRISLPPLWTKQFVYTETLAGDIVGTMPAVAMEPTTAARFTPVGYRVAAQDRIDPMLFAAAGSYDAASIRFDTEVLSYVETGDGVVATVRNPNGTISRIRSDYLVAADGGKSPLRQMAGITETGRANLRSFINNHIRADFSRFTAGREGALIWTLKPGVEGVFQPLDGKDLWAVQVQYDPATVDGDDWTEAHALAHIRAMIGDPAADDVPIEILRSYRYTLSMMVADRLRQGRLILTGDAAHQVPPYGGFGLNTGIQTAHNLAWKLAAILRGAASDALLDTYDTERREVAYRVCDFGRTNAGYVEQLMGAVRRASSLPEKRAILESSRQYGNWSGLDLGVHYAGDGAFVADDVPPPAVDDPVIDFVPHAKPGHRAPHFWARRGGDRVSSIFIGDGRFVLLAARDGADWIAAARQMGTAPGIDPYRVADDGDLVPEGDFAELYGIGATGAVLVRPDGHVAFRARGRVDDAGATLRAVMDRVLRRVP